MSKVGLTLIGATHALPSRLITKHVGGRSCIFVLRIYIYFMMNISSIEIVDKLLYDTGKYWWTDSLDKLKQFVEKNLEITGNGLHQAVMSSYLLLRTLISLLNGRPSLAEAYDRS